MEKRVYFKNLNGLRFIAAALVIFHHVEQYKFWAEIPNVWGHPVIDALGAKSVSFFFVLSGFLITYLLMEEEKKTSSINIRNFYVRRVLRIWPVYFLVVWICLFALPFLFDLSFLGNGLHGKNFMLIAGLLVLVLPNVVRLFAPHIVGANQLWSIGVEEQFYLVWPVLVSFFYKSLLAFLMGFILLKFLLTAGLYYISVLVDHTILNTLTRFWILLKIEQMAIGAVGAWVLFHQKEKILSFLYHKLTWWVTIAAMIALFSVPTHHWVFFYAEAIVFVVFILNVSTNPAVKINLENRLINSLGNISFGIYMYHTICITACLYVLTTFSVHLRNPVLFNLLLYVSAFVTTIAVAHFSYEHFEKFFLGMKERFMIVKSGNQIITPGNTEEPAAKA